MQLEQPQIQMVLLCQWMKQGGPNLVVEIDWGLPVVVDLETTDESAILE